MAHEAIRGVDEGRKVRRECDKYRRALRDTVGVDMLVLLFVTILVLMEGRLMEETLMAIVDVMLSALQISKMTQQLRRNCLSTRDSVESRRVP